MREAFDHCPAGWIRQSRKCCTKIIHNQMVVDNRSMSTANFALRGFCPNVLTLKAVLMMLDLPGPQRRMANRQCAHRHRINTDMSACVCQCDREAFSTVAHVLARCGLVFPRGCPFIAIANDKGRSRQQSQAPSPLLKGIGFRADAADSRRAPRLRMFWRRLSLEKFGMLRSARSWR